MNVIYGALLTAAGLFQTTVPTTKPPGSPPSALSTPETVSTPTRRPNPIKLPLQIVTDELVRQSILRGDSSGAITPPAQPIPRWRLFVLMGRALCVTPLTGVSPQQPWFASAILALNTYAPVVPPNRVASLPTYISREAAAITLMQLTTSIQHLAAFPLQLPSFADELQIAPNAREPAKRAVYLHLMSVGEDNMFNPRRPFNAEGAYRATYELVQQRPAGTSCE